jgi:hypothetical protein
VSNIFEEAKLASANLAHWIEIIRREGRFIARDSIERKVSAMNGRGTAAGRELFFFGLASTNFGMSF